MELHTKELDCKSTMISHPIIYISYPTFWWVVLDVVKFTISIYLENINLVIGTTKCVCKLEICDCFLVQPQKELSKEKKLNIKKQIIN